jgi:hypothetical protein
MGYEDIARESVSYSYGRDKVKSEEGKVCQVILGQRLFFQMGVDKPEAP